MYAKGHTDGMAHQPATSIQHSYAYWEAQRVAVAEYGVPLQGKAAAAYQYLQGYADALKSRMSVTGPVGSHGSFARSAPTQSTIVDFRRSVTRQYAPDITAAANIAAHNKAVVRGPVKERPEVVYSTDVVPLADKRSCYVVTTMTTKGTSQRTNEARRQAAIREAQDMAELRRLDAAGRLTTHQFERMGSRMGTASPSNK